MTFTFPCTHGKHKSFNSEPWSLHQLIQAAGYQRSAQLWNWSLANTGWTPQDGPCSWICVVWWKMEPCEISCILAKSLLDENWLKPMDSHVMIVPRLYWILTSLLQVASTMPFCVLQYLYIFISACGSATDTDTRIHTMLLSHHSSLFCFKSFSIFCYKLYMMTGLSSHNSPLDQWCACPGSHFVHQSVYKMTPPPAISFMEWCPDRFVIYRML